MKTLFWGAEKFNKPLNRWNTSKVNNMEYLFCKAKEFNQPINSWDTSKVTNMMSIFQRQLILINP